MSGHSQFSLLTTRRFLPLFIAQAIGAFNDNAFRSALSMLFIYGMTREQLPNPETTNSLSAAFLIVPFFLFSAFAGQLADKYDKALIARRIKLAEIGLITIASYSLVGQGTPLVVIVLMGLALGLFNSLQFSSMNSMAYADINDADTAMASTLASTLQQMSMSFGLAFGSLITAYFLGGLAQSDRVAVTASLHHAFLALAVLTMVSSAAFWTLRPQDGESVSKGSAELV